MDAADVPAWAVAAGVGHAVVWTEGPGGWTRAVCGAVLAGGAVATGAVPARVCRACRRGLRAAVPAPLDPDGARPVRREG